ncbi:MAG: SRPBCC family protein [Halanaeroarchaeum sp.]
MTVRVERTFDVDAEPDAIWEFLADPVARARAISVVDSFDRRGDRTIWHIALPIPLLRTTIDVTTRDVEREEPSHVSFEGRSSAFDVTGEHTITPTEDGSRVRNVFVVDGHAPGVERFFERNFESEIHNLERALKRSLADR